MTLYGAVFYLLGIIILGASVLAVTRRNTVHAVVFLIASFLGTALLFYLLGAPFLAAVEVIIYAGAIMVLFLFVIMTLKMKTSKELGPSIGRWGPAVLLGTAFLLLIVLVVTRDPVSRVTLEASVAEPAAFGRFVFENYWLAVEIISLLLLVALVAVIHLGRGKGETSKEDES
jgi:NADH-quinone oxidoreductase subunit J